MNEDRFIAGFTIIEVIVVSLIVAVLAAVAIPMYGGYVRSARIDLAKNNCQLIGMAVMQAHNRGVDIPANDWDTVGIQDPTDAMWKYEFGVADPYLATAPVNPAYPVKATGLGQMNGVSGVFKPYEGPASRWEGDLR